MGLRLRDLVAQPCLLTDWEADASDRKDLPSYLHASYVGGA